MPEDILQEPPWRASCWLLRTTFCKGSAFVSRPTSASRSLRDSCPQGALSPLAQDLRGAEFPRTLFCLFETEAQKGPATCAGPRAMSEGPLVPGDLIFHLPCRGEGSRESRSQPGRG